MISLLAAGVGMAAFLLLATSLGYKFIGALVEPIESKTEQLLLCVATGVIGIQLLVMLALITNHVRAALVPLLSLAILFSGTSIQPVIRMLSGILRRIREASEVETLLGSSFTLVVVIEFLSAMAPLTASDALHYHFAVPAQILRNGFRPDFFLSDGFLCGESHLLILMGLAFGSERLAMGLVFLGGILSAVATFCLARRWISRRWAWITTLSFLLTPLVFWQVSSPGAPDLWMVLFTIAAVLVISKARELRGLGPAVIAGCLAGGIAGAKYTGCFIAAALLVALLVEMRSLAAGLCFAASALFTGIWPYLRNALWTGDPLFPFLLHRLSPTHVNSNALFWYMAATGAGTHIGLVQIAKSLVFAGVDPNRLGFFQFFGPLVLAFSPLLFRTVRNTPVWRATLIVWLVSVACIGSSSGMARFQLPIFPLALAASITGVAALNDTHFKLLRIAAVSSIAIVLLAGFAGLLIYTRNPVKATLGLISRENYLRQFAPEYQASEFTNDFFQHHPSDGNILVFNRHLYYFRVPFIYGFPAANWGIDPSALQTPDQWREFFSENHITWVIRNPRFPPALAVQLEGMERDGELVPVAQTEVENFLGKRIAGVRERTQLVILRVGGVVPPKGPADHETE